LKPSNSQLRWSQPGSPKPNGCRQEGNEGGHLFAATQLSPLLDTPSVLGARNERRVEQATVGWGHTTAPSLFMPVAIAVVLAEEEVAA
jgi:hypothetical protein